MREVRLQARELQEVPEVRTAHSLPGQENALLRLGHRGAVCPDRRGRSARWQPLLALGGEQRAIEPCPRQLKSRWSSPRTVPVLCSAPVWRARPRWIPRRGRSSLQSTAGMRMLRGKRSSVDFGSSAAGARPVSQPRATQARGRQQARSSPSPTRMFFSEQITSRRSYEPSRPTMGHRLFSVPTMTILRHRGLSRVIATCFTTTRTNMRIAKRGLSGLEAVLSESMRFSRWADSTKATGCPRSRTSN